MQIVVRSGLSLRKKLFVMAGVVDCGYVGEIEVLLYNAGEEAVCLPKHARIAQLLYQNCRPHFHGESDLISCARCCQLP